MPNNEPNTNPFWSLTHEEAYAKYQSAYHGLSQKEAESRHIQYEAHTLNKDHKKTPNIRLFLSQFKNPITLILLFASVLSLFLNDPLDAGIIFMIIFFSATLGFWQEKSAGDIIGKLLNLISIQALVLRDNKEIQIPLCQIVPGDIVCLSAGDVVPADCLILEEDELFVDEAAFTGETFPVEKKVTTIPPDTPLAKRINALFMGAHIVSGTAKALVIATGEATEFGHINQSLKKRAPETEFERGLRKFGYLLMQITLVMVLFIFSINVFLGKPVLSSLLFTLAIAVGLTPQLLPAIVTVNLSKGAKRMAKEQVIVKRLNSIENFGTMNVLCSDKTGTLTEGKVRVHKALDCLGNDDSQVLHLARINAIFQQGFKNPIDAALISNNSEGMEQYHRMDEIPYDFIRKRLSILISDGHQNQLITKGAVKQILKVCDRALGKNYEIVPIETVQQSIQNVYQNMSAQGFRTLGIAYKDCPHQEIISKNDESGMIFAGFVSLYDPMKEGIDQVIAKLHEYGIELKVITGDNALVARSMSQQIGMSNAVILTGSEMRVMSDAALFQRVHQVNVFAEVEPNQKERIILALKKAGKVVGYMGDGINDVSAIHAADVGLSVDSAVDVAKEAADIVLLNQNLNVLIAGVKEGRRTFANTQKYIFMATSANFGNMFSMSGASLFLSFLPLLPKQILLTNLLTDVPSVTISSDHVDEDWIKKPHRWNIGFIKKFMVVFGILSSLFDYLTFSVLLFILHAGEQTFQTAWFIESVISATLIVLVIRTRKTILQSFPGIYLLLASLSVVTLVIFLPYLPFASLLGFVPLPKIYYAAIAGIVIPYLVLAEFVKHWFYQNIKD